MICNIIIFCLILLPLIMFALGVIVAIGFMLLGLGEKEFENGLTEFEYIKNKYLRMIIKFYMFFYYVGALSIFRL